MREDRRLGQGARARLPPPSRTGRVRAGPSSPAAPARASKRTVGGRRRASGWREREFHPAERGPAHPAICLRSSSGSAVSSSPSPVSRTSLQPGPDDVDRHGECDQRIQPQPAGPGDERDAGDHAHGGPDVRQEVVGVGAQRDRAQAVARAQQEDRRRSPLSGRRRGRDGDAEPGVGDRPRMLPALQGRRRRSRRPRPGSGTPRRRSRSIRPSCIRRRGPRRRAGRRGSGPSSAMTAATRLTTDSAASERKPTDPVSRHAAVFSAIVATAAAIDSAA